MGVLCASFAFSGIARLRSQMELVLHEGNTTPTSQRRRTKKSVSPNRRNTYSAADLPSLVPKGRQISDGNWAATRQPWREMS